jgi:4-amino-4-deoxy-L-arabinose transferase-like glycosyltransferase
MSTDSPRADAQRPPRVVLILLLVFAVVYLPWLAVEPPIVGLESTRILVAREMVRSGDWIVPTQNGLTYLAKPPFGYWLIAIGSALFGGVGVASARLVSALCMLALALCTALFARRELGARVGLLAGLCVLGTGLCVEKGLRAELEASFALFTSLAILSLFRAVWSDRHSARWSVVAGVALGAATLIKGPFAILVFLLALGAMAVATRTRCKRTFAHGTIALLIAVLIGSAWLAALAARGSGAADFRRLQDEVFKRVHDAGETNREPWWYYGPALLVSFLPATLLLPALIARRSPARSGDDRERSLFALLAGWSLITVIAMSASAGKEARYLIATIPGWSLLAAWAWHRPDAAPWLLGWRRALVRAGLALAWIVPPALAVAGWKTWPAGWIGTSIAAGLAVAALVLLQIGRRSARTGFLWAALLVELFALRVFWAAVPMSKKNAEYPIAQMGAGIAAHLAPGEPLVQVGEFSSYVQLQVDHPFRLAPTRADVPELLVREPHTRLVLARTRYLAPGQEGDWVEVASWPFGSSRFRLLRVP